MVDTQPMWFYKDGDALLKALGSKYMNTFIGVKTWTLFYAEARLPENHSVAPRPARRCRSDRRSSLTSQLKS